MSGSRGKALQIEHECPQCGGPVVLEETDRFLSCGFCRVRLYILSRDFLRYYFPPKQQQLEETIFVPYWRFRGMYFSVRPFEIKQKVLDTSFLSAEHRFLPASMGLRTQALTMKFASSRLKSDFIRSQFPFEDAISRVERGTHFIDGHAYTGKVYHRAFVGDTVSMIYTPVYIKNRAIYDGILDRPITNLTSTRAEKLTDIDGRRNWQIRFASALCPDCGWDLSGERDSVVLFCRNCDTAWHSEKGHFRKVLFGAMLSRDRNVIYLPFWKMTADINGIELRSFADLVKMANLPKAIQPQWHERMLHFWSPAFKVYPKMFVRLARQVTVVQPEDTLRETLPKVELYPVTLDNREAFESIKVILANAIAAKRKVYPLLPEIRIVPQESMIVYMPFTPSSNDYVQTTYRFSVQRNTILRLRATGSL